MNLVFIQGKIISEIDFKFIINSNNKSIAIFKIELFNKSIVTAKAYVGVRPVILNSSSASFVSALTNLLELKYKQPDNKQSVLPMTNPPVLYLYIQQYHILCFYVNEKIFRY